MSKIYETAAHAAAGRGGLTSLDDGTLSFELAVPGSGHKGANPEQLFALGYAACFDSAAKAVARRMKLGLEHSETHVAVALMQAENLYRLAVEITLKTTGLTPSEAQQLLEGAHAVCPYSNALRGNADVTVRLAD